MRSRPLAPWPLLAVLLAPSAGAMDDPTLGGLVHPPPLSTSGYDQVTAADAVVLARAAGQDGADDLFTPEEVWKGNVGHGDLRITGLAVHHPAGERVILELDRDGDRWRRSHIFGDLAIRDESDRTWLELYREYARIAAIADRGDRRRALEELQRRAAADPDHRRLPITTAEDIDSHLHLPAPQQPFADQVDFYQQAVREDERVAALWAMVESSHPEVPAFLRGILASGRDLGGELAPLAYHLVARHDADAVASLAAALARTAEPFARRVALEALVRLAERRDFELIWGLLADSTYDRTWEARILVPWFEARAPLPLPLPRLAARYRRWPADAKLALLAIHLADPGSAFAHDLLLAGDDPRGNLTRWLTEAGTDTTAAIAAAYVAPPGTSPRRLALLAAVRSDGGGWPLRWSMLQDAYGGEASLLLGWFQRHPPARRELADLVARARCGSSPSPTRRSSCRPPIPCPPAPSPRPTPPRRARRRGPAGW